MMTPDLEEHYKAALSAALDAGYALLAAGKPAVDVVEATVKVLEDSPLFNAGKGSVFTAQGEHEMDASIMDGSNLKAGAVALVGGIKNPISLARDVMDKSEHVMLAGEGAMEFAASLGYKLEPKSYFHDDLRYQQWQEIKDTDAFQLDHSLKKDSKFGTVGAVACDSEGRLAAATSTGGMTNKRFGRVGDSPLIGVGNYANNQSCAVSCTGSGEFFIRAVTAYDLASMVEFKKIPLAAAADEVVHKRLLRIGGDGGLIAIDRHANIAMPFNTEGMYRACRNSKGREELAIYGD